MSRFCSGLLLTGLLTLAGCTRPEDYVAVAREQQKAMDEVTAVLSKIHDAKEMAGAKAELDERLGRFDAVARKANALPKPPPPEAQRRLQDEEIFVRSAFDKMAREVKRVHDRPGGAEFFDQFEGRAAWLREANPVAP